MTAWQGMNGWRSVLRPFWSELGRRSFAAVAWIGDQIVWTVQKFRRDGRAVGPPESRVQPAPSLDLAAPPEVAGAALRPLVANVRGEVTLVLGADSAVLRVVELPTRDPGEIASMAELQLDQISPFPIENLVAGYELLEATAERTCVLLAALPRAQVEQEAARWSAAGLDIRRIDLDILAWWRLLADQNGFAPDRTQLHLILTSPAPMVMATDRGQLRVLRLLAARPDPEELDVLAEELQLTLTALEMQWGIEQVHELVAWFPQDPTPDRVTRLGAAVGLPARAEPLAGIPPLTEGAVRRACDDPSKVLNLAPPEWAAARHSREATRQFALAAAVCWAVWFIAVGGFLIALYLREASVERLRRYVEVLEKPAAEVRATQARIRSLEVYADRTRSALEILREVSADLPPGLTLTSFSLRKGRSVSLRGEADAVNAVYDFFATLERSGLFKEVKPEGVTSKPSGGRARTEFRVTAVLPGEEGAS